MAQKALKLDGGWMRPIPERQGELFPRPLDELLDLAGLTREHLRSWHQKGWLSFDDSQAENLDNPHFCEIVFIRNLVWDLKEDSLVNLFLKGLGKPYRYDPARTAFSFSYGWVQTPDLPDVESDLDDRCAFIDKYLDWWISYKCQTGERKTIQEFARKMLRASEQPSGRKKRKE